MDQRLTEILDNRPSAIRNTIVIKIIHILAGLVGFCLFIVGLSIVTSTFLNSNFFSQFVQFKDSGDSGDLTMYIIGFIALVVGLILFVVVRLCKMLIKRNMFLLELDEWRYDWEEREKDLLSKNKV